MMIIFRHIIIGLMLAVTVTTFVSANGNEHKHSADTCYELSRNWNDFLKNLEQKYGPARYKEIAYGPNPITHVLDEYMSELQLDRFNYYRIRLPLRSFLQDACASFDNDVNSKNFSDISIHEMLDQAVSIYGLDRSLSEWGLIELPEIDFNEQTVREVLKNIGEADQIAIPDHANNIVAPAIAIFSENFDLVTQRDFEQFHKLLPELFYLVDTGGISLDALAKDILNNLAEKRKLKRK